MCPWWIPSRASKIIGGHGLRGGVIASGFRCFSFFLHVELLRLTAPFPAAVAAVLLYYCQAVALSAGCIKDMKRFVGAVSGALRGLIPRTTATAAPNAVHQEQVRKAMESLAPKGRMLPSESKALAMEITSAEAAGSTGDQSHKTPEEMHLAANAFHQVCILGECCVC